MQVGFMKEKKTKATKAAKTPKEIRAEIAAMKQKKKKDIINIEFEFKKFFTKAKRQKNIDPSLEEIIWVHFKSAGFDQVEKFEEGLKHFGI
jgi:5-hydroxyisourate hydrolase-like protein (transthyretin family)